MGLRIVLSTMCLVAATVWSSVGSGQQQQLVHRGWTLRDHAPRFVGALAQDRDGYLWVGSNDGLFRFDGLVFEAIAPPRGQRRTAVSATALVADPRGGIWVGYNGHGGVARYQRGQLRSVPMTDPPAEVTDLNLDRSGRLWVSGSGEGGGLRLLEGRIWKAVPSPNGEPLVEPGLVLQARNGTTWVSAWNELYYLRKESRFVEKAPYRPSKVSTVLEDPGGSLWLIDTVGIRRLPAWDEGSTAAMPRPVATVPPNSFVKAAMDQQARIWGTTVTNGVFSLAPGATKVERVMEADGLTSDRAWAVLPDRSGNIWVGTERGLDRLRSAMIRDVPGLPRNAVHGYSMAVAGGGVYISSGPNVWRMSNGKAAQAVASIPKGTNALCGGTAGDVWAINNDEAFAIAGRASGRRFKLPAYVREGPTCAVDGHGSLWVASSVFGLVERLDGAWRSHPLPASLGEPEVVTTDHRGRLLIILSRRTIVRLDGSHIRAWRGERIGFEEPTAFSQNTSQPIVGGLTGLLRLGEDDARKLDVSDHPWLRNIRGIAAMPDGRTWLLGYYGVFRVATDVLDAAFDHPHVPIPHETFDQDDARIAVPQRSDGLQAAAAADGTLWMLTRRGVMSVAPKPPAGRTASYFPVRIVNAAVDGRTSPHADSLVLPNSPGTVTLAYGALDLTTALQRRYRTKLYGVDRGWVDRGDSREVSFANLSPGRYRFVVQTNARTGEWQTPGASLDIIVRPAFYETPWFLAIAVIATLSAIWIGYRSRMNAAAERMRRRLEAKIEERERIARELHDTFLQGVQGLMLRFQAVANMLPADGSPRGLMEIALERGDDVLLEGRNRVLDLRGGQGRGDLRSRLQSILGPGHELLLEGDPRDVGSPVSDEIVNIVSEAVTNAERHAGAAQVAVELIYARRALIVTITDDGVGIDPTIAADGGRKGHFGLVGMRERADRLKATLTVARRPQGGTLVRLVVPGAIVYAGRRWWRRNRTPGRDFDA